MSTICHDAVYVLCIWYCTYICFGLFTICIVCIVCAVWTIYTLCTICTVCPYVQLHIVIGTLYLVHSTWYPVTMVMRWHGFGHPVASGRALRTKISRHFGWFFVQRLFNCYVDTKTQCIRQNTNALNTHTKLLVLVLQLTVWLLLKVRTQYQR